MTYALPEECDGLSRKCSFKLLHFLWKLTGLPGQFWQKESALRQIFLTMKWYLKWIIYELRIWNQVKKAWKIQDFNGVWTRALAIPVRRSNQLSYEATDVGSWSFVGSNVPVRNESTDPQKWELS